MEIIKQLTDLDAIEVTSHGLPESYFEPTAADCCCAVALPADEE